MVFGYLAMFMHMGKLLGVCTLMMAIGSFTMFLPHALSGLYELGPRPPELCDLSGECTYHTPSVDCMTWGPGLQSYVISQVSGPT